MNVRTQFATQTRVPPAGTVFYDGDCRFCIAGARRFESLLARRGFSLSPLQSPGTAARLGIDESELLTEMRLKSEDGAVYGGADGIVEIARHIWWSWPLWAASRLPGVMPLLRSLYRRVAVQRDCANGACEIHATKPQTPVKLQRRPLGILPLVILPVLALFASPRLPRWGFMWALAFALYAGCKWLTLRQAEAQGAAATRARHLGYLLAWPGMDARAFLGSREVSQPRVSEWAFALLKTLLGLALLVTAASSLSLAPLLRGWLAMAGVVFVLHFGGFHLLSLLWRSVGVDATPVMLNPLRSTSLSEFWGRRWNTAFHELASRFTFRPLRAWFGVTGATFAVFLVSGLLHDLVISVPAQGGYGLPTVYFLLQAAGIAVERAQRGREIGLGKSWRGWIFTVVLVAAPAFWLFHPSFVRNVILPMLDAVGKIGRLL